MAGGGAAKAGTGRREGGEVAMQSATAGSILNIGRDTFIAIGADGLLSSDA